MNNRILFAAGAVLAFGTATFAQTSFDAAVVSSQELNGTSRYVAMGGAMGALGSDISVINQNPAGIGTFRQSDFNATMSIMGAQSRTNPLFDQANPGIFGNYSLYSHNSKSDLVGSFDNVSIVLSGFEGDGCYANFGFSYHKVNNSDCDMDYIDSFSDDDGYMVYREYRDHRRIMNNSFDFNLSFNVNDKMYFGATMGILQTDTWTDGYYYDYYPTGSHPDFPEGLDYTCGDWQTNAAGAGVNMAFGMIVRPVPTLRLGAAFKSPTWMHQSLDYFDCLYALRGEQKDGKDFSTGTDYRFTSPWSLDLSAGYTIGSTAFGLEYERHFTGRSFLSVGGTRMDAQGAPQYRNYSTVRFGFEHNIGKLALRAGYCGTGSMLRNDAYPVMIDSDFNDNRLEFQLHRPENTNNLTFGLGYCSEPDEFGSQFYADMAYVHGVQNSKVCANEYLEDPVVKYQYVTDKIQLTLGINF